MIETYNILVVEDDINLSYLIGEELSENKFGSIICNTGKSGLNSFKEKKVHLCLLDIVLPDMDGISLAKEIRKIDQKVPIVFLTSRNLKSDKLLGYEVGADDYITKPFDAELLSVKLGAIIKRCYADESGSASSLDLGKCTLEISKRKLLTVKNEVKLSGTECGILKVLFANAGKSVSRDEIMKEVWGNADFFVSKSLDVYMTKIRKMLRENTSLKLETIHGLGYSLQE